MRTPANYNKFWPRYTPLRYTYLHVFKSGQWPQIDESDPISILPAKKNIFSKHVHNLFRIIFVYVLNIFDFSEFISEFISELIFISFDL